MRRIVQALGKLHAGKRACAVIILCTATAIALPAQVFTTLFSFYYTNGANPVAGLVQGTDGNLYGTTAQNGTEGAGTLFKITPTGTLTTLYNFCSQDGCTDGLFPYGTLVQGTNGDFYGTTYYGGSNGGGAIFKITPSGALTTLYSFCSQSACTDGANPSAGLIQVTNGDFYGTTVYGGANCVPNGCGTIFKMTPDGTLTTLYSFCFQNGCTDGELPYGVLVQNTNGDLYGTTQSGGANCAPNGCGTIFEINAHGTFTTLYSFCAQSGCPDGEFPYAGLVHATNGNFYGTAESGGANGYGTVFRITPTGTLTTLYNFCSQTGCADGEYPYAPLVQATDGAFYGTAQSGGAKNYGTVFRMTTSATLTMLHSFCSQSQCRDGEYPNAGLVQATNGDFYGTAVHGGGSPHCTESCGSIFGLSVGLKAFVKTQPEYGMVGAVVNILGTNLTEATSVTFNGTAAVFTVVSKSEITVTVPVGATSGKVQVITPGGTLPSNMPFHVLP